ncbi:serine/threonine protein kinase [Dulcicalothrix desertica PCC 7102]|uniref:Serine/threonine protein kinase n=1 Tax=Dulcicalothrix desertica PCC 7102 TaxID=232991 RepID=A0A433VIV8_9CYAN|nr:serine/threonine-protein kinase [Dulcicalothrix desertica]RUT06010.1 serine/threonine protein kinase [Dulcicalothrix desertica PCC 7102]TWH54324.1 serine/threonine protein kinase [Dulcicalothrix desertica PCC 7102]
MLEPGQVINNCYRLEKKLGQDTSRQTWLATFLDAQQQEQEQVVLKLLTLSPQMQWDEHKLFEREATVLKNLEHPRIPKYKDYFIIEDLPGSRFAWFVLVQSYIPGASLQELLNQGYHFSESQVEKIAVEILSILIYLHELEPPVLHRDIKPSNLILGEDDRVYLVDFGAVQDKAVAEGVTFTVVGTYGYVPMEQFAGRAVPASDLYALGTTLIHLLTGTAPADLPHRNSRIEFANLVSVNLGLINWVGKLTEPNIADRISTAKEAIAALKNKLTLSPPITTNKPTGSKIKINKSASQLEIKLARRGNQSLRAFYLIGLFTPFFWQILQLVNFSLNAHSYAFWFYFLIIPIFILSLMPVVILPVFGYTYLYFDRDKFEMKWKLFGLCYWRKRGKTKSIQKLYKEQTKVPLAPIGITIELIKGHKFTTTPLSTVERHWLIDEIADWLKF